MNKGKKLLAVLSTAAMLTTVAPVIPAVSSVAFADTTNTVVGAVPSVSGTGTTALATVKLSDYGNAGTFANGDIIVLTLPSGVKWNGNPTVTPDGASGLAATVTPVTDQVVDIKITAADAAATSQSPGFLTITTPVNVTSTGSGAINLNIAAPGTGVTEGNLTIGTFVSGGVNATVLSTETNGGTGLYGTIRLVEDSIGALDNGKTVTLELPSGYTWGDTSDGNPTVTANNITVASAGNGTRTLTLTVTAKSATRPGIIDITTPVTADNTAAKGDLHVSVGGSGTINGSTDLVIGTYADWGTTVTSDTAKSIDAGVDSQTIADVTVEETVPGSIVPGRTITFDLPDNVRWGAVAPTLTLDSGNNIWATAQGVVSNNGKTATFTMTNTASTSAAKLKLEGQKVDVSPAFSGDLHVTVGGTAGVTGDIVPATVSKIANVTSNAGQIQLGVQDQNVADFTVQEGDKGTFTAGNNVDLVLPAGATWAVTPTVTVTDGDLEINSVTRATTNNSNDTLRINIKSASSVKGSTIKVTGAQVTTDSTLPGGPLKATIGGSAVSTNAAIANQIFASTSGPSVVVGNVVTGTVTPKSTFVIGQTSYTVDGVQKTMDVAPYISKDGRTMSPVRYIAYALGLDDSQIVWDQASQTATLIRNGVVAQFTVGANYYVVNGAKIAIDTTIANTNGRVFLPARYVAQAFGVPVAWDQASQTVTVGQ